MRKKLLTLLSFGSEERPNNLVAALEGGSMTAMQERGDALAQQRHLRERASEEFRRKVERYMLDGLRKSEVAAALNVSVGRVTRALGGE